MPIAVLFGPFVISIHNISWSWSSRLVIWVVLLFISFLTAIATPPPLSFLLFLYHSYPGICGGDIVFVIAIMWASLVFAALIRLVALPVMPFALQYNRFMWGIFLLFLLFFDLLFFLVLIDGLG